MSSSATERGVSVTVFGTTEFRSEVAGRRAVEIFEIYAQGGLAIVKTMYI